MLRTFGRFFCAALSALLLCAHAWAQGTTGEAASLLPDQLGEFRATAPARTAFPKGGMFETLAAADYAAVSEAERLYAGPEGETVRVTLVKTGSDGAAYSLLTHGSNDVRVGCEFGAACVFGDDGGVFAFSKGPVYVRLSGDGGKRVSPQAASDLARRLSETLDAGAGGVPVLAMHLPEWERVKNRADFAVSLPALQSAAGVGNRPALDALSFEGGAEAATANYSGAQVVVVEFTTPQYASDNDARVKQRISELRAAGQPAPTAYRREGNYAVFVFDAPDEAAAEGLLAQVRYEKDVRWLGRNPHEDEMREQIVTSTMGGVIVTTLKVTGLAILLCLGVGGLFGGAVFLVRRSRSSATEVYTDAGGMLRLNIEEANAGQEPPKLLEG